MRSDVVAIRVRIAGRVQGVGYRAFVQREAHVREISGFVRNLRSGDVEAVFVGERHAVEAMIEICRKGPRGARVDHLATSEEDAALVIRGAFEIAATISSTPI